MKNREIEHQLGCLIDFFLTDYKREKDCSLLGLMTGRAGVIVTQAALYKFTGNGAFLKEIESNLEYIFDELNASDHISPTYANGIAGIGCMLLILKDQSIISYELNEILLEIDDVLSKSLQMFIVNQEYDILHESLGIGLYLIKRKIYKPIGRIIEMLELSANQVNEEVKWKRYDKYNSKTHLYDFGLAHGNAGILYFLGKCWYNDIERERCKILIDSLISFYFNNIQYVPEVGSYFPNCISVDEYVAGKNLPHKSRTAWCYGDLGIVHTIHMVANWIADESLMKISLNMLKNIASRRGNKNTLISDLGICHGSSGNGIIFLNLFRRTKCEEFKQATEYYVNLTLEFGKSCESVIDSYVRNISETGGLQTIAIITGMAGPALLFSSFLKEDNTSWEEVFFLK